jgi:hypothetical protein
MEHGHELLVTASEQRQEDLRSATLHQHLQQFAGSSQSHQIPHAAESG